MTRCVYVPRSFLLQAAIEVEKNHPGVADHLFEWSDEPDRNGRFLTDAEVAALTGLAALDPDEIAVLVKRARTIVAALSPPEED